MLSPYLQPQLVTKILVAPNGESYRVVFLVTLVDGKISARVVSAEPLNVISEDDLILCLPHFSSKFSSLISGLSSSSPIASPYVSLLFFTSQLTRAPAYIS
ncbi:MAG: hypothetical protein A2664_03435 [Candidatus Taylorbacteria bacterium RIFCSPHIGHO2_01_FULL_46_22b]|uniref:Uncharacterized protein n=1 Tax=Candidatus Taylorbacteria bacterium RIFCSPHIGHO2_01_FULL_46_22b TaxID=1802301 RepID=A0A1G2M178_9BACT|nr:MAG: hypothetical protein A2664_03435 [Candidatus Taylorbacteria bacterium RIFCSPHIGHO2_01_FULL_46_22b]